MISLSYCVNCGVELDPSAKKCALCSAPVYNPKETHEKTKDEDKPFSDEIVIPKKMQRKFIAYIITMIMLIPNIVLLLINIFFFRGHYWAVYIASTSFLLWILFVFPFITKKTRPYLMWAFDTTVGVLYSFIVVALSAGKAWLWEAVASVIGLTSLASLFFIVWVRNKKRTVSAIVVHLLIDAVTVSALSGLSTSYFSDNNNWFVIGIICAVCFASLLGFGIYCDRSKHMRAWFKKIFYI